MKLLGIPIHAITEEECIEHIMDSLRAERGGWVVTPNLDHLRRLHKDSGFRELCLKADLRVADGRPLIWASKLQGTPLPARVAGSDLISTLTAAAAAQNFSIFMLGGSPGTAEGAARALQERHPLLRVAGTHCPPMGFEKDEDEIATIRRALAQARPSIVFVGLGSPKQEQLIDLLRAEHPMTWWLGVGISFSFLCGDVARAPRWMRRLGIEWIHRLMQEPRRLARRYLLQGLPFACLLLSTAIVARFRKGGTGWG